MLPRHMLRPYGFGEILLTQRSESGVLILKNEPQVHPCSGSISDTMVKFSIGGSGFLVSNLQSLRIGSTFILGLVLTAAHVLCEILTNKPIEKFFCVILENGDIATLIF